MKLINKWLQNHNKYFWKKMSCFMLICIMVFSLSGCQKDELKGSEFMSTVVSATNIHFLYNFGITFKDDIYQNDLVIINKYATKIVPFNFNMYNEIVTKSQLIQMIDEGTGINSFPLINLLSEGATINICFGVLINGDYYLVKLTELYYNSYYVDSNNLIHYVATVDFIYKF